MTRTAHTNYFTHHRLAFQPTNKAEAQKYSADQAEEKKKRVFAELKAAGMTKYGLMRAESRELPFILHDEEHIKGIVYGRSRDGFAELVATDKRVLFVDKKPFFMKADEVTYDLVGGVTYGKVGLLSTITLHTRISHYTIRTVNFASAKRFIDFIELRCLENTLKRERAEYDHFM